MNGLVSDSLLVAGLSTLHKLSNEIIQKNTPLHPLQSLHQKNVPLKSPVASTASTEKYDYYDVICVAMESKFQYISFSGKVIEK